MRVLSVANPPLLPVPLAAGESIYSTVFPGGVFVVRDDGNDDLRTLVLVNGTPSITQKRIFTIKAPDSRAGELKIEAFVEVNKEWVSALFESRVMHPADTNMPVVGNFTDFKNILTAACKVRAQGREAKHG